MRIPTKLDGLAPPLTSAGPGGPSLEAEPVSDAEIIARSVTDPECFEAIFDRHTTTVHRYLTRRLGRTEADDLLGEVFLRAFEHRGRFRGDAESARPWLLGIATNLISLRNRGEERQFRALARAVQQVQDDHFPEDRVAAQVDAAAAMDSVSSALASLATGDRDVLLLFAWGDLTYPEIAAALDIPVGTVRSRLSRTRTHLRSVLPASHLEGHSHE